MSFTIRTGFWTDWSRGSIVGATLTLSPRDGALLLAFIAAFVTAVSSQLWRIIGFAAHQIQARPGPHDGLHYQTQVVLRNASSPLGAAWLFLQQSWSWRRRVCGAYHRTLIWAVFSILYLTTFAALAVFSSQVSRAASNLRLIRSPQCGYWEPDPVGSSEDFSLGARAFASKVASDVVTASRYARACYTDNRTSAQCSVLPTAALPWKGYNDTNCPFNDVSACEAGQAVRMETGLIDSQLHLGINTPPEHRLILYKNVTCAPVAVGPFSTYESLSANETATGVEYGIWQYNFGPKIGSPTSSYTFRYNTAAQTFGFGYTIVSHENQAGQGDDNTWLPVRALQAKDADVSIFFILMNSVHFIEPCNDPVFAAHTPFDDITFAADRPVSVISCIEQNQICNSVNDRCSPLHGRSQMRVHDNSAPTNLVLDLNLNVQQIAVLERIDWALMQSGIYDSASVREVGSLRAADTLLSGPIQLPLPANQWQLEVTGWFEESLARLQHLVQEYATGPTMETLGSSLLQLWIPEQGENVSDSETTQVLRQAEKNQCYNQITRDPQGTISFSVLGLAIVFTVGVLIIVVSLTIVSIVDWVQRRSDIGEYKRMTWLLDDMLQLQRMFFSEIGLGTWSGTDRLVPTTSTPDKFEFGNNRGTVIEERAIGTLLRGNQKGGLETAITTAKPEAGSSRYFPRTLHC